MAGWDDYILVVSGSGKWGVGSGEWDAFNVIESRDI